MDKLSKACTCCKQKKLKCDGLQPVCSRCKKSGITICRYPPDKRIDKTRRHNGNKMFIFKDHALTGKSEKPQERKQLVIQDLAESQTANEQVLLQQPSDSIPLFPGAGYELGGNVEYLLPQQELEQANNYNWSDLDIEHFLRCLDDSLTMEAFESLSQLLLEVPLDSAVYLVSPHQELIDAVFYNQNHKPPAISRDEIMSLDMKPLDEKAKDEIFLESVVLALGSLTLAKRDLVRQRTEASSDSLHLKIKAVASDAFDFYSKAKSLIPVVMDKPTKNGFRGMVLMANYMSILHNLATQMQICYDALQVAVSLNLDSASPDDAVNEDSDLVITFWSLWCSACMLSAFHGRLPPIRRDDITTTVDIKMSNRHVEEFVKIRIELADLYCQVVKYVNQNGECPAQLTGTLMQLNEKISHVEDDYALDERSYHRREVLNLELNCWKSQIGMLIHLPRLDQKKSTRSANVAKSVIKELWSYYEPDFFQSRNILENLDWNFSYPLRTATISIFIACIVLVKYIKSVDYLNYEFVEYKLGLRLLRSLTSMMPINKYLLDELEDVKNDTNSDTGLPKAFKVRLNKLFA